MIFIRDGIFKYCVASRGFSAGRQSIRKQWPL